MNYLIIFVEDLKTFLDNKDEYFNNIEKDDTGAMIISKMKKLINLL